MRGWYSQRACICGIVSLELPRSRHVFTFMLKARRSSTGRLAHAVEPIYSMIIVHNRLQVKLTDPAKMSKSSSRGYYHIRTRLSSCILLLTQYHVVGYSIYYSNDYLISCSVSCSVPVPKNEHLSYEQCLRRQNALLGVVALLRPATQLTRDAVSPLDLSSICMAI